MPNALPYDWPSLHLIDHIAAKWLACAWLQKFVNGSAPWGVTLHMTGYAPTYTKSVDKGRVFFDIRRSRRLLQKGYIFCCCNRTLVGTRMSRALRCPGLKTESENSALKIYVKLLKRPDIQCMSFAFIWNKENEVWHITSIVSFSEKLQKLLSVNTETKHHLRYQIWHGLHKYALKGRFLVNDAI